jgi:hypothetical protein
VDFDRLRPAKIHMPSVSGVGYVLAKAVQDDRNTTRDSTALYATTIWEGLRDELAHKRC